MAGYAVGWDKDPVPLFERFYLGGSELAPAVQVAAGLPQ